MARLPRFVLPGQPQHVIQRGNNRCDMFHDALDHKRFLYKLAESAARFGCDTHAYVLMSNHVHLLVTPHHTDSIARMMQTLGRAYVPYFNRRYGRCGTLWEGRYRASLIDSERYFITCMRYIELNPVRAGMVNHPLDYPWSSYRRNACGDDNEWLVSHPLYLAMGQTPEQRQLNYRALVERRLDQPTLDVIRDATNHAWVLGDKAFRDSIELRLQRQAGPVGRGGDHRSPSFRERHQLQKKTKREK